MTAVNVIPFAGDLSEHDLVTNSVGAQQVLELYDREQVPLRRYLFFIGVDVDTADEAIQEAFLKLHQHILAGGDQTNLRAWLYRVAHNIARNAQTSFRNTRTNQLSELVATADPPAPTASAEEELLARERREGLRVAIGDLTPAQRSCLTLRSQGLKYREIAETLGLSTSTVAENVQRALENLKERI